MRNILIALAMVATAGAADASITPVLVGSPIAQGGGIYAYTYDATLASDQGIVSGSYFTLYDFAGFTGFGAVPTDWTATAQAFGRTPAKTVPTDTAILNVTFTYTGAAFNTTGARSQRDLGDFTVLATGNSVVFNDFTSLAQLNHGPTAGTPVATIGSNAVGVSSGTTVPEPATWLTMIAGLSLIGVAMRARGPRNVAA